MTHFTGCETPAYPCDLSSAHSNLCDACTRHLIVRKCLEVVHEPKTEEEKREKYFRDLKASLCNKD